MSPKSVQVPPPGTVDRLPASLARFRRAKAIFSGPDVSSFIACFGGHGVRDKEPVVVVVFVVVVVGWVSTSPGEKLLAPAA
jgi:hypothetical protein